MMNIASIEYAILKLQKVRKMNQHNQKLWSPNNTIQNFKIKTLNDTI